ncbi:hypothetical protein GCM10023238_29960 [Streptomyces heliomycini]
MPVSRWFIAVLVARLGAGSSVRGEGSSLTVVTCRAGTPRWQPGGTGGGTDGGAVLSRGGAGVPGFRRGREAEEPGAHVVAERRMKDGL